MNDDEEKVPVHGGGVAVGVLLAFALVVPCVLLGPFGILLALVAAVAAMLLWSTGGPFAKGLGIGLLVGGGILALLVGTCIAMASGID